MRWWRFAYGLEANKDRLHLCRQQDTEAVAAALSLPAAECDRRLAQAMGQLAVCRRHRRPPAVDDKRLTAWNALAVSALACASRRLAQPHYATAAAHTFAVLTQNYRVAGRTTAGRCRGELVGAGFLDDVAFLLAAALELLRVRWSTEVWQMAYTLAEELCTHFEDTSQGGFFFTADDGEMLIRRIKSIDDSATPSGNGVAVQALLMLSWLSGEGRFYEVAMRALRTFYATLEAHSMVASSLLQALQMAQSPPAVIWLTGEGAAEWQRAVEKTYRPDCYVITVPSDASDLPPFLAAKVTNPPYQGGSDVIDETCGYICRGFACQSSHQQLTDLQAALTGSS